MLFMTSCLVTSALLFKKQNLKTGYHWDAGYQVSSVNLISGHHP